MAVNAAIWNASKRVSTADVLAASDRSNLPRNKTASAATAATTPTAFAPAR